jgi:predicted RNase H-like nuclease (RuvC/YqgF family)
MKLKSLLPWLCVLGLGAGLAWMYAGSQKKDVELAALRKDSQQLQQLRAEIEEAKTNRTQAESDELTRLRKDNEELLRLRNEASQLRGDKQRLSTQLQTAQAQAEGAQAQFQALRGNPVPPGSPGQLNPAAQAALAARSGLTATNSEQVMAAACINNLRVIDGAKQQWALEHQKPRGALLTAADLSPYVKSNTLPVCPAGGIYTLNPVGLAPICNIPGHALPR